MPCQVLNQFSQVSYYGWCSFHRWANRSMQRWRHLAKITGTRSSQGLHLPYSTTAPERRYPKTHWANQSQEALLAQATLQSGWDRAGVGHCWPMNIFFPLPVAFCSHSVSPRSAKSNFLLAACPKDHPHPSLLVLPAPSPEVQLQKCFLTACFAIQNILKLLHQLSICL